MAAMKMTATVEDDQLRQIRAWWALGRPRAFPVL
jgi:hypothetical protein